MAYGRLEVYYPDGRLETYMLEDESVSVGRADGNTIPLDTDTISRYHFSIVHDGDHVTITDLESANGTFVDGIQLKSNEPYALGDVEEIMLGSLRVIYRQVDDSPTMMVATLDEETQRTQAGEAGVHVEIDQTHLRVWPAASSSAELSITNLTSETRDFSIEVSGMPTGWLRLTRPEIELDSHETAYILLNIKPPRRPNTVPRQYELTVAVAPLENPAQAVYKHIKVDINAYSGFGMAVGRQAVEGDPVPVFLHNQGSSNMRVRLTAHDPASELRFHLPGAPLELQAGQRLRVDLTVASNAPPLVGQTRTLPFVVQVQSLDASRFIATTEGKATVGPRLPLWGAVAGVGIIISALILAGLLLAGVLNPPDPVINSLSLVRDQVARGENITLMLDIENANTIDVLINQVAVESGLDGDVSSLQLDTTNLDGNLDIAVIARNGARSTRDSVNVQIYQPIALNEFSVLPNPVIRNTVNTLTISWDVEGAVFVRISGLSDFTNNLVQPSTEYDAVYTLEGIGGIPEGPLDLTLYAEDQGGTSIEVPLRVPILDPLCTALTDVNLYEGPDTRYQQVATIPVTTSVVVLAQDAESAWLRLQLPEDIRGWGPMEAFDCEDTFNISALRTEVNVPELPTPLPQLTPTPTPEPQPVTPSRTNTNND